MVEDFLWTEKYRPKTIDECILPDNIKKTFKDIVKKGHIPNLLLSGTAGTGKTTIAKALANELNADTMVINGSLNAGIDTLRTDIKQFASSVSFSGGRKLVILDEADYLSCFSKTQKIRTSEGIKTIDELRNKETFKTLTYNFGSDKVESCNAFIKHQGKKEIFEVEFEDGSKMYCTEDHPFFNKNKGEENIKVGVELLAIKE